MPSASERLLEHAAGDLTATAEAGLRLSALQEAVARHGQMLALDPPGDPMLGAVVADNLSGPRRHRYGGPRDLLIGITVVLADGTIARAGGKVVKNVAGYDLGKLFCGSRGRLGRIAEVTVRLHPLPAAARTLVVEVSSPAEAERLAQVVHRSTLVPSAVDLLWPGRLALLFEGGVRAVESQLAEARGLLGGEEDASVWDEVAARQLAARGRLSFSPGELRATLERTAEAVVRVGAGTAYVPDEVEDDVPDGVARLRERVRAEFA